MKRPGRRISAGWSFTAGTLFGALAIFALPAALHNSRARVEASTQPQAAIIQPAAAARSLETNDLAGDPRQGTAVRPAPAAQRKNKTGSQETRQKAVRHSELELQLD
jgi:hypothetical protein